jgi:hypothetical protein
MTDSDYDEFLGRRVREAWIAWAKEQPNPKLSWLTEWDDLDPGQREVDIRIGRAVAAAERERLGRRDMMLASIKTELDDGFQLTNPDGVSWNHVSRQWVERLLIMVAALSVVAEREACIRLAEENDARILVPCDDVGCNRTLHTHHRRPFAELLRSDVND